MTDMPRMTAVHVSEMQEWDEVAREGGCFAPDTGCEFCKRRSEILSVIKGLADGSLRCADSTEVVVKRKEIEALHEMTLGLPIYVGHSTSLGNYPTTREVYIATNEATARWLSTPEQPATENVK